MDIQITRPLNQSILPATSQSSHESILIHLRLIPKLPNQKAFAYIHQFSNFNLMFPFFEGSNDPTIYFRLNISRAPEQPLMNQHQPSPTHNSLVHVEYFPTANIRSSWSPQSLSLMSTNHQLIIASIVLSCYTRRLRYPLKPPPTTVIQTHPYAIRNYT